MSLLGLEYRCESWYLLASAAVIYSAMIKNLPCEAWLPESVMECFSLEQSESSELLALSEGMRPGPLFLGLEEGSEISLACL